MLSFTSSQTWIGVSLCYYLCVLIPMCVCPYAIMRVSLCFHACVLMLLCVCPYTYMRVSLCFHACVLMLPCVCPYDFTPGVHFSNFHPLGRNFEVQRHRGVWCFACGWQGDIAGVWIACQWLLLPLYTKLLQSNSKTKSLFWFSIHKFAWFINEINYFCLICHCLLALCCHVTACTLFTATACCLLAKQLIMLWFVQLFISLDYFFVCLIFYILNLIWFI